MRSQVGVRTLTPTHELYYSKILGMYNLLLATHRKQMDQSELDEKLGAAFDSYFQVSDSLKRDLTFMLDVRDDSMEWKRNYLRSAIPLIEGYCSSFRDVAKVYLETGGPLHKKQKNAILDEKGHSADERIKLNIKAAHTVLLDGETNTGFDDANWDNARTAIEKRGAVMHPQSPRDLEFSEGDWEKIESGITWLTEQVFGIYYELHKRVTKGS